MSESAPERTAVVTVVKDRLDHLAGQRWGLAQQRQPPLRHVVVHLGGAAPHGVLARDAIPTTVVPYARAGPLPLAAARNAGAEVALQEGPDALVFLDVDCIPEPTLVADYASATACRDGLCCGPVTYLDQTAAARSWSFLRDHARPHPARPSPPRGAMVVDDRHELFWSLSFAVRPATFTRLGGFHEGYLGYGGEDTDLGFTARRQGVPMVWLGAAHAWHQWHPTQSPPRQHVQDIVRNACVFHARWGEWPMSGWLSQLADEQLVDWDPAHGRLRLRTQPD